MAENSTRARVVEKYTTAVAHKISTPKSDCTCLRHPLAPQCQSPGELKSTVVEEWDLLQQALINILTLGMSHRYHACLAVDRGIVRQVM